MRIDFLLELTRRRITDRYVGTSSRLFWAFLSPVIPLVMNVSVFYFIAKIPQVQSMGVAAYAVFMFSGLLPFRIVQRATLEGCELLVGNMDMLKSAVFPLPFLSLSAVCALLVEFLVQCVFMAVLLVIADVKLGWTIVLFPLCVAALFAFSLGLSWIASILNYALRDLQEILSLLFSVLLYFTPIMYPTEAAPSVFQTLIDLNPLSSFVMIFRDAILSDGAGLHFQSWVVACTTSAAIFAIGYFSVDRARRFVGDLV